MNRIRRFGIAVAIAQGLAMTVGGAWAAANPRLTVWTYGWEREAAEYLQQVAADFGRQRGVKIDVIPVPGPQAAYDEKLMAAVAGGRAPDVALVDAGTLSTHLAHRGALLPLDPYGVRQETGFFLPPAWDALSWQGQVYGLRLTANNLAFFYHRDLWSQAGLAEPKEDWTWEELRQAARKLTDPRTGRWGLHLPVSDQGEWVTWTWMTALWQNGGEFLNDDRSQALFHQPEGVEALQFWVDLIRADRVAPPQALADAFVQHRVAMEMSGPWSLRPWSRLADVDLGIAFLPRRRTQATNLGGEGLVVFAQTRHPQEAVGFVRHVTTTPAIAAEFARRWYTVPALRGVAAAGLADQRLLVFVRQMAFARLRPFVPQWPQISKVVGASLHAALQGNLPARTALEEAAARVNRLLASRS